jgi:hypothetical protein
VSSYGSYILNELKANKVFVFLTAAFIFLSYSIYLYLDEELICSLGRENHLFEGLTPVFFLAASVILFRLFFRDRSVFLLLLSLFLFVGAGEEVSWGQKLLHFRTPAAISKANVQHEFNIHNLEPLNSNRFDGTFRMNWSRILTINFLYKVFWFCFGVLLPLGFYWVRPVKTVAQRIRLPVPPLCLGVFFLLNYLTVTALSFLLPDLRPMQYYDTGGEIYECGTALIFLLISLSFLRTEKRPLSEAGE